MAHGRAGDCRDVLQTQPVLDVVPAPRASLQFEEVHPRIEVDPGAELETPAALRGGRAIEGEIGRVVVVGQVAESRPPVDGQRARPARRQRGDEVRRDAGFQKVLAIDPREKRGAVGELVEGDLRQPREGFADDVGRSCVRNRHQAALRVRGRELSTAAAPPHRTSTVVESLT